MQGRTIGEVSADHRVPGHVLRHWEDVGALRPDRAASGHRRYRAEHDSQIELIKCGKVAGLSLVEIAAVLHGALAERGSVLSGRLAALDRAALEIDAAKRMLQHVQGCRSPGTCTKCSQPHESFRFPAFE